VASVRVAEILSEIVGGSSLDGDVATRLVMACTKALPVTGVGLVLMTDEGPAGTVAITDGPAGTMEELQFTLGEGPCVESSSSGRPVLQPDLARTGPARWPAFSAGAHEAGIRAIFAFPLRVGGIRLGVLDLYRNEAGELSPAQLTDALSFADAATAVLLHLQAQRSAEGDESGTIPVVEDRAEVHQATGMISVQAGVAMSEALVRLRARAYAEDRPILALAHDVLSRAIVFTGD
jgi:GAF domain-containing protein